MRHLRCTLLPVGSIYRWSSSSSGVHPICSNNRHFAPEGASVEIVDAKTGKPADPVLVDRLTGRPLVSPEFKLAPGPAARESTRRRLATSARDLLDVEGVGP
jgi:hypothetical protein